MFRIPLIMITMLCLSLPALGQDDEDKTSGLDINNDRFQTGSTIVQNKTGVDDLFMAGATVRSEQPITGSAHLAGRKVVSNGAIGGDAYLAGMDVTLSGKVTGDATVAGYVVKIGEVSGDVRVSGANVTISGPVGGYMLIAGEDVTFDSVIQGNVSLKAEDVSFTQGGRIDGNLTLYEEELGEMVLPAQFIAEERVERRDMSEWSEATGAEEAASPVRKAFRFVINVLIITALVTLVATLMPKKLADLRSHIVSQPLRALLFGVLSLATAIGATILLMFTGVGIWLAPIPLLGAFVGALGGYLIGVNVIGTFLMRLINRPEPDQWRARALAAGAGALTLAILGKIPVVGWLLILTVASIGAGAIPVRLFKPKFFAAG